jgi:ATP synthase protein I
VSDAPNPGSSGGPSPARYAGLGVQLAAVVLLGVLGGRWLDQRLGTGALFTIGLVFLGFGGTMYSLVRTLNQANRDDDDRKRGRGGSGGET